MKDDFEKLIIKALYSNKEVESKVIPELKSEWFFSGEAINIVNNIIEFNGKYNKMPNVIETERILKDDRVLTYFKECLSLQDEEVNTEFILGEIEEFVKKKLLINTSSKIQSYVLENKKIEGSFSDLVSDAETFSFDTSIGFSFFEDPQRLYEDANVKEKIFGSGLNTIDELLSGGFHEKSLNLIMGGTNIGKTLVLCSLATNFVLGGSKVLYITFEDSENKIASRIAQNMFDISQEQYKTMSKENFAKVFLEKKKVIGGNNLVIKEYPEGTVNALMLKSLLKDLGEKKDFKPDILIIDYIGCMIPNGKLNPNMNTNSILTFVSMQVRSIAMEFGFPIISGSQTNRGGYQNPDIDLSDSADSFGQNMKADAVIGITQTPDLKLQNIYNLIVLKTRYGNKRGETATIGVNIEKQKIFDIINNSTEYLNKSVSDNYDDLLESDDIDLVY